MGGMQKAEGPITATENFWKWVLTEPGRQKVGQGFVIFGGTCSVLFGFCWNVLFVDLHKDAYMENTELNPSLGARITKDEDRKIEVTREFLHLFTTSRSRAGLTEEAMSNVDIFFTWCLDPVRQGTINSRQGAVVGLPRHMVEEELDLDNFRVKPFYNYFHKGFRLPSGLCQEARQDLKQTLLLTPSEQQFVMARELAGVDNFAAVRETVILPILLVTHYIGARRFNDLLGLLTVGRTIRWPIQAALAVASLGIYTLFKNLHLLEVDHAAVTAVVRTSEQAEVAAGFYQKMLDRNLVLRQILGPDGDGGYCFTDQGEQQPWLYEMPSCTSLKVRRDACQQLVHQLDTQKELEHKLESATTTQS